MLRKNIFLLFFVITVISVNNNYAQNIPMKFHNGSFVSIYLNIPSVMNPNLSPKSNSGVSLDAGQEVYFFPNGKRGKKEVLFVIGPTWKKDTILEIDEIVRLRKKSLGY